MIKSILVAGVLAISGPAWAQAEAGGAAAPRPAASPAPPAATFSAAPTADPFEQVITARHVADFARRRKSAQAMIVAARMLQEVKFSDQSAEVAPTSAAATPGVFTAEGLYAEAEQMAKGDAAVLTQIRVARSSGRGVLSSAFGKGLVRTVKEVGARAVYAFEIEAKSGELLRIGAIGDSTIRMALRLRDKAGKLLCDDSGDYAPVCAFKPLAAAALRVEVFNQGNAATRAVILSN